MKLNIYNIHFIFMYINNICGLFSICLGYCGFFEPRVSIDALQRSASMLVPYHSPQTVVIMAQLRRFFQNSFRNHFYVLVWCKVRYNDFLIATLLGSVDFVRMPNPAWFSLKNTNDIDPLSYLEHVQSAVYVQNYCIH